MMRAKQLMQAPREPAPTPTIDRGLDGIDSVWQRIQHEPDDSYAALRVDEYLRSKKEWLRLVDVLLSRVDHLDSDRACSTLNEIARIYQRELGDADSALCVLKRALTRKWGDTATADALERMAAKTKRWSEIAAVFQGGAMAIGQQEPMVAGRLWLRTARVWLRQRQYATAAQAAASAHACGVGDEALRLRARALIKQAEQMHNVEDLGRAEDFLREALEISRRIGIGPLRSHAWAHLTWIQLATGRAVAARRMIGFVEAEDPLPPSIRLRLVELQLRLGNRELALQQCKLGLLNDPHDHFRVELRKQLQRHPNGPECLDALARMLAQAGELDKAIDWYRSLVCARPLHEEPYRQLYGLFRKTENLEGARCAAGALIALGAALPEERELLDANADSAPAREEPALSEEDWQRLRAPNEDPDVRILMSALATALTRKWARRPSTLGLKLIDVAGRLTQEAARLATGFGMEAPLVFLQPAEPGATSCAMVENAGRMRSAICARRELVSASSAAEVRFWLGRALGFLRPECRPAFWMDPPAFRVWWQAAQVLSGTDCAPKGWRARLRARRLRSRLSPLERTRLSASMRMLVVSREDVYVCLATWRHAVWETALRLGLVACGDVVAAATALAKENGIVPGQPLGRAQPQPTYEHQLSVVLSYSVSADHLLLRTRARDRTQDDTIEDQTIRNPDLFCRRS